MQSLLNFLVNYQNWIYTVLLITAVIYGRKLIRAIIEWRSTIFGLEREFAQHKLNTSLAMVILSVLLIIAEFICVNFIISALPQATGIQSLPATTDGVDLNIVATSGTGVETGSPNASSAVAQNVTGGGCIPGQIEWIAPKPGEEISGIYNLMATVNILDMGFFKYDYASLSDPTDWHAISAGNMPVVEGKLGVLATSEIPNGDYILRLTVVNKSNQQLAPCDVAIRILNKE